MTRYLNVEELYTTGYAQLPLQPTNNGRLIGDDICDKMDIIAINKIGDDIIIETAGLIQPLDNNNQVVVTIYFNSGAGENGVYVLEKVTDNTYKVINNDISDAIINITTYSEGKIYYNHNFATVFNTAEIIKDMPVIDRGNNKNIYVYLEYPDGLTLDNMKDNSKVHENTAYELQLLAPFTIHVFISNRKNGNNNTLSGVSEYMELYNNYIKSVIGVYSGNKFNTSVRFVSCIFNRDNQEKDKLQLSLDFDSVVNINASIEKSITKATNLKQINGINNNIDHNITTEV